MKMTMQTPGRDITIELPKWIEDRIIKMFITKGKTTKRKKL